MNPILIAMSATAVLSALSGGGMALRLVRPGGAPAGGRGAPPPRHVGLIGAGAMSVHSLLDGVAMAAAFQASPELGLIVSLVVVIHRFSDGIGIVSLLLANRA